MSLARLMVWVGKRGLTAVIGVAAVVLMHGHPALGSARDLSPGPDGGQWSSYNKDYKGQRFSPLEQINAHNAGSIREICRLQVGESGSFEAGPVIVHGTMYLTTVPDTFAIDPRTCKVRWKSSYRLEETPAFSASRGVAVANGRVFRGTADARLLALDARTGKVIWKDVVGDPTSGESISSAPLAWNGMVFTATAGADLGIKGRVLAYDAVSGREAWRFVTIPTGNQIGADSWMPREAAETGGGGTWGSFAIDVDAEEIFVPVANPAPSFAPEYRRGANLFTDSVVVLDARTGALKWWYQLDPNDSHDLDLAAAPVLYANGAGRDVVAAAGKDGYVHVVDRLTHRLLFKTATTTIENEGVKPSARTTKFCPGGLGGTSFNGPALDPRQRMLFVASVDWCNWVTHRAQNRFIRTAAAHARPGDEYTTIKMATDPSPSGWLVALDSDTGVVKWKYHATAPIVAGVTATAGGIVMTGDTAGNFLVLDSATGRVLYKMKTQGGLAGGVVTYAVGGRQYVAFTSGNISRSSLGAPDTVGVPTLMVLALNPRSR